MAEANVNPTEEEFSYFCCQCKKGFGRARLPFILIASQETEFTCVICRITFASGFQVLNADFNTLPYRCEVCGMRVRTSTQLLHHSYHHSGDWPF
ncbi:hypothetical protein TNIN_483761 [Trichonephila inaurata madagascariensis]|uniref:C2H2-type domain-containing protein n=1 Tax=Trichonephila inaurata madagascariensis TaxID=2747483 RepID=A0A8X6WTT5_9ARAC|nr:hypothetical protein TNIN_483761 [Trichonephila inaurata madagascariensis]